MMYLIITSETAERSIVTRRFEAEAVSGNRILSWSDEFTDDGIVSSFDGCYPHQILYVTTENLAS